ncbi:MAG: peptide-methionine (R)-S-oxide reductase [Betaproteobacteria bacterium]|nr:peptide-methionine (R)-S-oxide reductase [Betaproteobacteria bacterium]
MELLRQERAHPFITALSGEMRHDRCARLAHGLAPRLSSLEFDSGIGGPDFSDPSSGYVGATMHVKRFVRGIEQLPARCGGHRGQVFKDGSWPITGVIL